MIVLLQRITSCWPIASTDDSEMADYESILDMTHTWVRSMENDERGDIAVSIELILVRIQSTRPNTALSHGTKLPICAK